MASQAVLLMAYGAARDLEDLERYYTHIRHGRPPTPPQLQDLTRRYQAIGGRSPLYAITRRQAVGLEQALQEQSGFQTTKVYVGMKHASPFIADAVETMTDDPELSTVYGLVLAPHFSTMSVAQYMEEAKVQLAQRRSGIRWVPIWSWHRAPGLIALLADRLREGLRKFGPEESVTVLFTAHSLPEKILEANDPYPQQIRETGEAVMTELGSALAYEFGWQSQARTPEPWLGPDLLVRLEQLASQGARAVLVCPVGFVSDHLEILYDIDIQAQARAQELGVHLERTASLNDDERLAATLAAAIVGTTAGSQRTAEAL